MRGRLFVTGDHLTELSTHDRAIVLVALVTGLRLSELSALRWEDVEPTSEGLLAWGVRSRGVHRSASCSLGESAGLAKPANEATELAAERARVLVSDRTVASPAQLAELTGHAP